MLKFFKSNNIGITFVNLALIIIYRLRYFFHPVDFSHIYSHTERATRFFIQLCHLQPQRDDRWLLVAGGLFCFIGSILVNNILNNHKVASKKNYLGGVLFVIFSAMVPDTLVLSPALVSAIFLLICIDKVFDLARPEKLYGDIFDLGFYSGIAMLFYFPSIYFLVLVYTGFFIVRSVSIRESMMIMTGFVSVLFAVFTIYFWFDSLPNLLPDVVNLPNRLPLSSISFSHIEIAAMCSTLFFSLWVLAHIPGILFSSVIQTRKYISILIINGVLSLLVFPLMFNFNLSHLLFLVCSLSILSAVYFVETKTNLITEFLFIVLILSVFVFEYLSYLVSV